MESSLLVAETAQPTLALIRQLRRKHPAREFHSRRTLSITAGLESPALSRGIPSANPVSPAITTRGASFEFHVKTGTQLPVFRVMWGNAVSTIAVLSYPPSPALR